MIRNQCRRSAYELREEGRTWESIGDDLGVSRKTARRYYDEYTSIPRVENNDIGLLQRLTPIHIYGDAVISADWHVPLHSTRLLNKLLEKAHHMNIKTLVIAGDFFHMETFSHFRPHQPEAKFEIERKLGTKAMETALQVFDNIIMCWGNHDFRMVKFLEFEIGFEYCMRWVLSELGEEKQSRIQISDLDHLIYHPGPVDIRLCHQKNYSKVPLTVPRQLVDKYDMSVLTAHSHHFAQGVGLNGRHLIFEGGGLFDQNKTEYIQRTTTNHTWVQGFYVWKDGICHPYSPIYKNI